MADSMHSRKIHDKPRQHQRADLSGPRTQRASKHPPVATLERQAARQYAMDQSNTYCTLKQYLTWHKRPKVLLILGLASGRERGQRPTVERLLRGDDHRLIDAHFRVSKLPGKLQEPCKKKRLATNIHWVVEG